MPELPEVETTKRGISTYIEGAKINSVTVRQRSLRWPIEQNIEQTLTGLTILSIQRRAKYLLFKTDAGTLIIHLGMSGTLRVLDKDKVKSPLKHDHVDIAFNNGQLLRFNDPRRFGAVLWTNQPIEQHKLIENLGPEPLSKEFNQTYLTQQLKNRKASIKTVIMNGNIVVGVGNIYASESLFLSKIHPKTPANKLTNQQCQLLIDSIQQVLQKAIKAGGTTLRDFRKSDGTAGYFAQELNVYGRQSQACKHCDGVIEHYKALQRATFYCPQCQH